MEDSTASTDNNSSSNYSHDIQKAVNGMVLQLLNEQVRKTCFDKCFGTKFSDHILKNEQICLAKCMDRMYEAHAVVIKASAEMAQQLTNNQTSYNDGMSSFQ